MKLKKIADPNMYPIRLYIMIFALLFLIIAFGCEKKMETKNMEVDMTDIKDVEIAALVNKRILFGHASVGNNIIEGIQDIITADNRFKNLRIKEFKPGDRLDEPGIYHFGLNKNGFPKKKSDHFVQSLIENDIGAKTDIAFFKYCYVDIEMDANVDDLFKYYTDTVESIHKQYPNIKLMHVTTPLYSHGMGMKGLIKRLIKTDHHNIKRNEFNEKLIEKYKEIDPVFDLAAVGSTYPDGSKTSFKYKGKTYYSLANEYTYDGGHLNKTGRYLAAKKLLKTLSEIALTQ